ncbi:NAD(P)-dependent oxidoreductase [Streptomyces sp. NPDC047117]|uniref:NAD(P)-dependent oxidoreductase n=1 Tax=Streptomyces sp. NPDC047117 TaxID=3155379 RepID=UPI0033CA2E1D
MIVVPDCLGRPEIARAFSRSLSDAGPVRIHEAPAADTAELIHRLRGASVVVPFFAGAPLTGEVLESVRPPLVVVAGPASSCVDERAARETGTRVHGTPGLAAPAVAHYTLALMLSLLHRIPHGAQSVRDGGWETFPGREAAGLTLGVVGLGRIGTRLAELASAIGMDVVGWSPRLDRGDSVPEGIQAVPLAELLTRSDVVSLHLRLGRRTRGLIGSSELALLREDSVLVNTARAGLVDMAALRAVVAAGKVAGVALDVHDVEPLPDDDILRSHPAVLATPHMAWMTSRTIDRIVGAAAAVVRQESGR